MSEPDWAPLTGFRVAVTSARRADELSALLQRRGATVTSAAAIAMVPLPDDDELRVHTAALIDMPPDIVIATTGIGFRDWVAAADGWGLTHELLVALGKARDVSRGPKATGALRAAGLPEEWSPESESSNRQYLWIKIFYAASSVAVVSSGRSTSLPFSNFAPARTSATRWGALTARQRDWAASISL